MKNTFKTLYIDMSSSEDPIKTDDFIIAIGKTKSNSVYHIAEAKPSPKKNGECIRYYLKVLKSDLITALKRDPGQKIISFHWYSRN